MALTTPHSTLKGIYATMWTQTASQILPHASHHFWNSTTITWPQKIQTLKARWGRLWNKKLAYRWHMQYGTDPLPATNDLCPICRASPDGASHILAGCSQFKGHYISRHDKAVKLICKGISKGQLGGHTLVLDAGADTLPAGATKRMPTEMRPPHVAPRAWRKLRPDIALIHPSYLQPGAPPTPAHPIHLVEIGYCSDTNHHVKFISKNKQHATLRDLLKAQGYKVEVTVITLGTTGTIPKHAYQALNDLGMEHLDVLALLNKLNTHSVKYLGHIIAERRNRDHGLSADHG